MSMQEKEQKSGQKEAGEQEKGRKSGRFIKNTVRGRQRGRPYKPEMRTLCLTELLVQDIHTVAQRHKIPESTLRGWIKQEREQKDPESGRSPWEAAREEAIKRVSAAAGMAAQMAVQQAIRQLQDNAKTVERRAELLEALKTEEESVQRTRMLEELELLEPMSDYALAKYVQTMTTATQRAGQMLGQDTAGEVTVTMDEEARQYAE